jgi:hypothetical protein
VKRRPTTAITRAARSTARRLRITTIVRLLRVIVQRLKATTRAIITIAVREIAIVVTAIEMAAEMAAETITKTTSNSFAIRYDSKS